MEFSSFPPEVLDLITSCLDADSTLLLWMAGDPTLNFKLHRGGVRSLSFHFGSRRMAHREIPSLVAQFAQLESFSWVLSTLDDNGPVFTRQLTVLSPTLRKLRLNRRLSVGDPLQDDNRTASVLSERFPLLEEIQVQDMGLSPGATLPETITSLECESCHGELPPSISTLIIHQVGTGVFSGLRNHQAHPNFVKTVETFLNDEQKSRNLVHFEYHRRVSDALSEDEHWAKLPRTLTRLYLMVEVKMRPSFLMALPQQLRHLSLGFCEHRGPTWIFTPAFASSLPRRLEYLHLFSKSKALMSMFADTVQRLPQSLTTLKASLVGDHAVDALPPKISTLECSAIGSAHFPTTLTSLTAGLSSLDDLPPLLCHLSLSVSNLDTVAGSKINSLHRLTDLTLIEQSRHGKTIDPFWPPSLTRFRIIVAEEDLLESEMDRLSGFDMADEAIALKWAEAVPKGVVELSWVGSVPAFQPSHLQLFPSSITHINYVSTSSESFHFLPQGIQRLEARILTPIDADHFYWIPKSCETALFYGFIHTLLPVHATILPSRLGIIRLCGETITDETKRAFQQEDIRVSFHMARHAEA